MTTLIQNILETNMTDVRKSVRDAALFALGLFLLKFLGALDPTSIQANTLATLQEGIWAGINAVYSAWLAILMPMLMRTVRSSDLRTQ